MVVFVVGLQKPSFDLAEGERELVRGFNTKYWGLFFVNFIFGRIW